MFFQRNKETTDLSSRFAFKILGDKDPQNVVRGVIVNQDHRDIFRKKSNLPLILLGGGFLAIVLSTMTFVYFKPEPFKAWWKHYVVENFQQKTVERTENIAQPTEPSTQKTQSPPLEDQAQRLSALEAQYQALLKSSDLPVETFKSIQQQVESLDPKHSLLTFPDLADAFVRETEKAIEDKHFERAHQLLQEWKTLLPTQTERYAALNEKMLTAYLEAGESYFQERMQAILTDDNLTTAKIEQAQQQLNELHKFIEKRQQVEAYNQQIETALQTQQVEKAQNLINRLRELDPNLPILPALTERLAEIQQVGNTEGKEESVTVTALSASALEPQMVVVPVDESTKQVQNLLQTCAEHLQANRLTSGRGGTAFACYHQVLAQDPDNNEAKQGLKAIEARYVKWAEEALIAGQLQKASQHLSRLAQVNPKSPLLLKLRQQLNEPVTQAPQGNEIEALLKTCADHLAAKRLTSGRQGTAFDCYQQVLKQDPNNETAKKGLQSIEETYIRWTNSALAKHNTQRAQLFLKRLQQVNPHSSALPTLQKQLTALQQQTKRTVIKQQVKRTRPAKPIQQRIVKRASRKQSAQKRKSVSTQQKAPPRQKTPLNQQKVSKPKTKRNSKISAKYTKRCSDLFSQESLGIIPLTSSQKAFQRQHCH